MCNDCNCVVDPYASEIYPGSSEQSLAPFLWMLYLGVLGNSVIFQIILYVSNQWIQFPKKRSKGVPPHKDMTVGLDECFCYLQSTWEHCPPLHVHASVQFYSRVQGQWLSVQVAHYLQDAKKICNREQAKSTFWNSPIYLLFQAIFRNTCMHVQTLLKRSKILWCAFQMVYQVMDMQ